MSNYEVDPNIKQILDLKNNKGVFPRTVDSAVIAHSPNGETTYLDSVVDYLYQLVANKLRLYTEQDGTYTKGKAYPATMGVQNANNIHALLGTVNNYASILSALQQQVNAIDPTEDIVSINRTILRLWSILNNLSEASEYSYQEIKFSDSLTLPPSDLDNTIYWKNLPMNNPQHLWLGIRTITIKRGEDGKPIITKGNTMVVPLRGPKGDKGERGERGENGTIGSPGTSYRPVLMYKWTNSRTVTPDAPTDPQNQGWTESPNNPEGENKYLWMTLNYLNMNNDTYINPTWSIPVCLSGEDGVGSDGTGIEFIFFRTNSINIVPNVNDLNAYRNGTVTLQGQFQTADFPFIGYGGTNIVSGNLWTDNPQGIELDNKYEWASFRLSSGGTWDSFCEPFRWSMWGEDGIDGDGVEYIYYLSDLEVNWRDYPDNTNILDPRIWNKSFNPDYQNYQNSEYIRPGSNWSDDPYGVTESNMYEYVSSRKKESDLHNPRKKIWGDYSKPVLWAKFGKDGLDGSVAEQGLSGPVVRFRGKYTQNTEYINSSLDIDPNITIRYIDVVYITNNNLNVYYMVKSKLDDTRRTYANPENSADWQEATGFSFIAAEALYARDAHINDLSTYEFVVQDGANHIVAGMTGGNIEDSVVGSNVIDNPVRIWAGSHAALNINLNDDTIPFKVFQNGKLKATNAEIKGNLSVDSLSLTGNLGSYYYNESAITLPLVNDTKHTVIFIITTSNATQIKAHSEDVLFALSNNNITTTSSNITLSKYKIYLAISIKDGQKSGWLLLNLNSIEVPAETYYYSKNIINSGMTSWSVQASSSNDYTTIPLSNNTNTLICTFTTTTDIPSASISNRKFTISGSLLCSVSGREDLTAKLDLGAVEVELQDFNVSVNQNLDAATAGNITVKNLIDIYLLNLDKLNLTTGGSVIRNGNSIELHLTSFNIGGSGQVTVTPVTVTPVIRLEESFNYTANTNLSSPVTTTTVGSNGFVIDRGSIVAVDMPEGATVNTKDCIVYKDVTEVATNEQYEVVNFGASNIIIGNTIVTPKETVIVKAQPNIHIDFSDVTAIDPSGIYDVDPVEPVSPANH